MPAGPPLNPRLFTDESINRLIKKIDKNECVLNPYGDITIGGCAISANITIGNSHDENGKPRFNYLDPFLHFYGPIPEYLYKYGSYNNNKTGKECCSPKSISFHYVNPNRMHEIYSNRTLLKDLFE